MHIVVWVAFALLALNAFFFINISAAPYVKADVWRHLNEIIIPIMEKGRGLPVLWKNHHPSPLLHIIQLINIRFAGFRLDLHGYLGFVFQTLTAFLLVRTILSTTYKQTRQVGGLGLLAGLLIVTLLLGFNNQVQYTWPLVSTVQYIYFFGILVFLAVDRCLRVGSYHQLVSVAALSTVLLFANADYGLIFLASIIIATILAYVIDRRHTYLSATLVVSSVLIGYRLILATLLSSGSHYRATDYTAKLVALFDQPLKTLITYSLGLSSGLVNMVSLKNKFPGGEPVLVGIALIIAVLFAIVFIAYLKKRLWQMTIIPLALMLVSLIFSAGVLVNRYDPLTGSIWSLSWPRYSPTHKLAVIGMLWALWLLLKDHAASCDKQQFIPKTILGLIMGLILLLQAAQIRGAWQTAPYYKVNNYNASLAIFLAGDVQENNIELPFSVIGHNKNYHDALAFLKRNKLNVFSDSFPKGELLETHLLNRSLFHSSGKVIASIPVEGGGDRVVKNKGNQSAAWEILPKGISITSNTGDTIYLRIHADSETYKHNGILFYSKQAGNKPKQININKGSQNLYFDLKGGDQIRINALQGVKLGEVELRSE